MLISKGNHTLVNAPSETTLRRDLSCAWQLRDQQQWKKAAQACGAILSRHPNCDEALHLLGLLAHERGDNFQAEDYLKRAISLAPDQASHHCNLGAVLNAMGRYAQAEACLLQAL